MVTAPLEVNTLSNVQQGIDHWIKLGAIFVNLPWVVHPEFTAMTRPSFVDGATDPITSHGTLVASGEQSFLQMYMEGNLRDNCMYVGWTPCFREEAVFDRQHHFYFVKAELFFPCPEDVHSSLTQMICDEIGLLSSITKINPEFFAVERQNKNQWDITLHGIELGSYGIRALPENKLYLYGTVVAEPRLSYATKLASSGITP